MNRHFMLNSFSMSSVLMALKKLLAPTKFVPLSDSISLTIPLLDIMRFNAAMNPCVLKSLTNSRWIALVAK